MLFVKRSMKVFRFFIYCLQRFLWLCFPRCFINNTVFNIICVAIRFRVNLHCSYDIWCASDCNRIWRHNHLIGKGTLNHLAMLGQYFNQSLSQMFGQFVDPIWPNDWVFVYELSGCGFQLQFFLTLFVLARNMLC